MNKQPLRFFFFLAFGISWGAGGIGLLLATIHPTAAFTSTNPLYYVAAFGPTLAGLIVTNQTSGASGLRRLLRRLLPTRAGLKWYFAVLIGYPAFLLVTRQFAGPGQPPPVQGWPHLLPLLVITILNDPGALGEELGWRGVALPGLLERWSPLPATLLLGGIWGAWHLPTFFIATLSQSRLSLLLFMLGIVSLSVIMSWLYLRTRGNLLLMILVHLVANFAVEARLVSFGTQIIGEAVVAGLLVISGGFRTPRFVTIVPDVA